MKNGAVESTACIMKNDSIESVARIMKKGDIFEFTTDSGVVVRAICIDETNIKEHYDDGNGYNSYLCYAQNRLFYYIDHFSINYNDDTLEPEFTSSYELGNILVEYCVIPEFDEILKNYE